MSEIQWKMKSQLGNIFLLASERGLEKVSFEKQGVPYAASLKSDRKEIQILALAEKQINEYLGGKRTKFTVPLNLRGTEFQLKVWKQLQKIPYGSTCSYKDMATLLGSKAYRAVGSANGANPVCIIVPCHRVIAANGGIGGYSGGLDKKEALLKVERTTL